MAFQSDAFQNDAFQTDGGSSTVTSSFAASAVLFRGQAGSFAANAIALRSGASALTADSIRKGARSSQFTVSAFVQPWFSANAWISASGTTITGTFTASGAVRATGTGSFTCGAVLKRSQSGSLTVDAIRRRTSSGWAADYASTVLADGPAAYYRLASTGSLTDATGNHDGTWSGAPALVSTLLLGDANAADKAISFASSATGTVSTSTWWANGDASVEVWVDLATTTVGNHYFIGPLRAVSDAPNAFYLLQINGSATLEYRWRNSAGAAWTGTWTIPSAAVYHLVLVKSGSNLILYVNGSEVGRQTGLTGSISSSGIPTKIGSNGEGPQFKRTMDEMALYAFSLSAERIRAHYQAGRLGGLAAGAQIKGTVTKTVPASAWITVRVIGSFTAEARVASRFSADAILSERSTGSLAANAIIATTQPDRIAIWIDGVDYTEHVVWATAGFTARVNGSPGDCSFEILDRNHAFSFTFGQEIRLLIDGKTRWGGWVIRPQHVFALPVVPNVMLEPRLWAIEGIDYNIIFDRRVVHDLSKPERTWDYSPGTYDDTIINDVWRFLDMSGFTKDIDRVAEAVLDIPGSTSKKNGGKIASGGDTLRDVMLAVTAKTAGIFYCTPEKVITYVDSDKVSNEYVLTDRPFLYFDPVFMDYFDRVVENGLGDQWMHSWGHTGFVSVDGETAIAQPLHYEGFNNITVPIDFDMTVQFDFWIQSVASQQGTYQTYYYGDFSRTWFDLYPTTKPSASPFELEIELEYRPGTVLIDRFVHHMMVDESSWYTVKVEQYGGGLDGGGSRGKVWKRGTPEPDWMFSHTAAGAVTEEQWLADLEIDGSSTDVGKVDNYLVWAPDLQAVPASKVVAYREIKIREDGANMSNDALVWGAGYGSQNVVFSRHQDDPSQNRHGRWQSGEFKQGVYKQTTVDAIAQSYVDGSPSAHRGAKHPKRVTELVTFSPAFTVGDVVNVECSQHVGIDGVGTYSDTLPIRQMQITFPTPYNPRFALYLSWEIDAVWSMFDPYQPLRLPDIGVCGAECEGGGCDPGGCDCGITDTFTRTVADGWGTSDAGLVWKTSTPHEVVGVDGAEGHIPVSGNRFCYLTPGVAAGFADIVVSARLANVTTGTFFILGTSMANADDFEVDFSMGGDVTLWGPDETANASVGFDPDEAFLIRLVVTSATTFDAYIWAATGTQPVAPTVSLSDPGSDFTGLETVIVGGTGGTFDVYVTALDISGVDRCSEYRFDNFNRVIAAGWGTSDSGHTWGSNFTSSLLAVDGSRATFALAGTGGLEHVQPFIHVDGDAPWNAGLFTMRSSFQVTSLGTSTDYQTVAYEVLDTAAVDGPYVYAQIGPTSSYVGTGTYAGGSSDTGFTFTIGAYNILWECLPGSYSKFKIWLATEAEPSAWTGELDISGSPTIGASSDLIVDLWGRGAAGKKLYIDYIDFDYTGKPCYTVATDLVDTFTRPVVSGGWGTADTGQVWQIAAGGGSTASVDGAQGLTSGGTYMKIPVNCPGDLDCTFEFTPDANVAINDFRLYSPADTTHAMTAIGLVYSGTDAGKLFFATGIPSGWSSDGLDVTHGVVRGTTYKAHVISTGPNVRFRVWTATDPEPSIWAIDHNYVYQGTTPIPPGAAFMDFYSANTTTAFDNLHVVGGGGRAGVVVGDCVTTNVVGVRKVDVLVPQVGPSFVGGTPFYPAGSTWRTTSATYLPGSTVLMVGGLYQRAYVESAPENGIITINVITYLGDEVTLSYLTNGALP